ncbi:MAG: response regulator transcription factor [Verrucomicrobia bacterium]|nr:response regulator transcription factor [Verrucomicrobiota bacterium]
MFLVADSPVIRASLELVLKKAGFVLVGQAGCPKEALAHSDLKQAEVVMVCFLSGGEDMLGLVKALRTRRIRSVVCPIDGDPARVRGAFAAGTSGYVTQGDEPEHLFEAVRVVAEGRHYVSPRAGAGLARKMSGLEKPAPEDELSKQQLQIYGLLGRGESVDEIARRIRISPRTVESYCYRMIEKLDISGMKALRRHAISNGNRSSV